MQPYIQVTFEGMTHDPSVEASVHRWVARLESASRPIHKASIAIERAGRRCTAVCLKLELVDGTAPTATASREDAYVAVADAFRAARRQLLARSAPGGQRRLGLGLA